MFHEYCFTTLVKFLKFYPCLLPQPGQNAAFGDNSVLQFGHLFETTGCCPTGLTGCTGLGLLYCG